MPYKLNKIIFQRAYQWGYETYTYDLNTEIDFPFVAGMMQQLVPKEKQQIKKYKPEISDASLFNEKGLTKLLPDIGPRGIYYLELRPGQKIKQLVIDPDDVVVDIYIGAKDTLIYSFYNPTRRNSISITASIEKDSRVYGKIKSDLSDIYWRQYFIRLALNKVENKRLEIKQSENMTSAEVAEYLNIEEKTIRNWTSENKIPFIKLGSAVRYPKSRIDSWLKTKEKKVVRDKVSK